MISLAIIAVLAVRFCLVAAHGLRFIKEAPYDRFIDEMQRENYFINVMKIHKWTYKQFYPNAK